MWEVEEANCTRKKNRKILDLRAGQKNEDFHAKIKDWRQVWVVSAAEEDPTHPQVCK